MSTSDPKKIVAAPSRATLHDVAATAGVSAMTVSRALNGKGKVSKETRDHIVKIARELGYRKSQAARSLRTSESRLIGMISPNLLMPLHIDITLGAKDALLAEGYRITFDVYPTTESDLDHLFTDGDLLLGTTATFPEYPVPFVARNRTVTLQGGGVAHRNRQEVDDCTTDLHLAILEATKHLLDRGYRRIALLQLKDSSAGASYVEAHEDAGVDWDIALVREVTAEASNITHCVEQLVAMDERPDSFLMAAVAATPVSLRALRRLGFVLPNDFGFVGIESRRSEFGDLVFPGITSIRIPGYEMGAAGARRLLERIRGDDGPIQKVVILSELVIRATTPGPRSR
jgi:LacI family transcriptional regulator